MMDRRSLFTAIGLALGAMSGCIDTLSGGRVSGSGDAASLTGQQGDVVELYEGAITERNDGITLRNRGIEAFNEEDYDRAISRFETAARRFDAAAADFSEAAALATDLGEDESASICETAREETELQLAATEAGLDAAVAARDGGGAGDVNEHVEEYQTTVAEAEAVDVAEPQALADVLQGE